MQEGATGIRRTEERLVLSEPKVGALGGPQSTQGLPPMSQEGV